MCAKSYIVGKLDKLEEMMKCIKKDDLKPKKWMECSGVNKSTFYKYLSYLMNWGFVEKIPNDSKYRWIKSKPYPEQYSNEDMKVHHINLIRMIEDCSTDNATLRETVNSRYVESFYQILSKSHTAVSKDDIEKMTGLQKESLRTLQALLRDPQAINPFLQHLEGYPEIYESYINCLNLVEIAKQCHSIIKDIRHEYHYEYLRKHLSWKSVDKIADHLMLAILHYLLVGKDIIKVKEIELNESNCLVNLSKSILFNVFFKNAFELVKKSDYRYITTERNILKELKEFMFFINEKYGADFREIYESTLKFSDDLVTLHNGVELIIRKVNDGLPLYGRCIICESENAKTSE